MQYFKKNATKFIFVAFNVLIIFFFSELTQNPQILDEKSPEVSKAPSPQVAGDSIDEQLYRVTRVIDGDTIEIETGQKVRYIGIDAPEKDTECYALDSTRKNSELTLGRQVKLETDKSDTDRYGRLLRYVYVDDLLINGELVKEGFAEAKSYRPDTKYQDKFDALELEARNNKRGMWGVCK